MTQMLELYDKNFKVIIIILQWEIMNHLEINEKVQNLSKEIKDIKYK